MSGLRHWDLDGFQEDEIISFCFKGSTYGPTKIAKPTVFQIVLRGIGKSFQSAITAPRMHLIGYGNATAQSWLQEDAENNLKQTILASLWYHTLVFGACHVMYFKRAHRSETQQNIELMTFAETRSANNFVGCSVTPTFFFGRSLPFLILSTKKSVCGKF